VRLPYFDLSGRVAVVSGGATGIGLSISEALSEAGATVVICSRRQNICMDAASDIETTTGQKLLGLRCDVADIQSINNMVGEVEESLGGIDILVNCAGVGGSEKPVLKMDAKDWKSVIDINLTGAFNLAQAAGGSMIRRGKGGRIINIASVGGSIAFPNMTAYCASKGGLVQLTKALALEWARYDILVNTISPGYIETPMNVDFFDSDAGKTVIASDVPMNRLGQSEEVKGVAILLASKSSSFMTGSEIFLDGGYTAR
tara:strand:- start:13850 stop:14623 length:774 start_codon:yes stop_codon:yes gene_type:complete